MIANLVTTIMLALGVATGNVSSNSYKGGNAFNHIEKPIQKANSSEEPITRNFTYTYVSRVVSTYSGLYDYNNIPTDNLQHDTDYLIEAYKEYFIGENTVQNVDAEPEYTITTTTYNYQSWYTNPSQIGVSTPAQIVGQHFKSASIIQITTYLGLTRTTFDLTQSLAGSYQDTPTGYYTDYESTDLSMYLDMTLTENITNVVNNIIDNSNVTNVDSGPANGTTKEHTYTIVDVEPGTTRYVALCWELSVWYQDVDMYAQLINNVGMTISGQALVVPINYEVIALPELLFDILTMPFAFYSQAFNLTIFPGTPYQINFANIILTMIAALTLMFIIKKVLK